MKNTKRKSALSLAAILSFGIATQTLGDIKTAQNALVAKDYETAIKNAKASAQQQPYDAALVMARALIDTGQPEQAAEFAQFAIELVPNSFAARVLYATALRHQNKLLASEIQFRRAIDVADTDAERALARQSMRAVERTKKWSTSLSLGIAPTTNVGKVSTAQRIGTVFDDFLQNFTRNEKPKDATGVFYCATITRHFRGPPQSDLNISLGQMRREYKDTDNNSKTTTLRLTSNSPITQRGQSYLTYERVLTDFAQTPYSQRTGVTFGHVFKSFGPRRANVSIGLDQTRYLSNDIRASKYRLALTHDVFSTPYVSMSMSLGSTRSKSDAIDYQSTRADLGANLIFHPPNTGWLVNLSVNRGWEDWDQKKTIFVNRRQDLDLTTSVSVRNQNFSFLVMTPVMSATYQKRESSVDLYDLDSRDYFIGISNAF